MFLFASNSLIAQDSDFHPVKHDPIKDSLWVLEKQARIEYQEMRTHPKLLTLDQIEEYTLSGKLSFYNEIVYNFDAKQIEFNSLFAKTIIENRAVHYFYFSPIMAIIWADTTLNEHDFLEHLNSLSMTPILQNNISKSIK